MVGAARPSVVTVAVAVLQAVVLAFLYLPAGLAVPLGGYVALNLAGGAITVAGIAFARRGRRSALLCPVATVLFWLAFVSVGAALFDWTA